MPDPIVLDTPLQIAFYRMAALRGALRLEMLGLGRSRRPSAYSLIKRDYGFRGSREAVYTQISERIERMLGEIPNPPETR